MFEITPDDISLLNDEQLRALVGLLCEAELRRQGHSPAAVTWGGDQNAADGGLDVRVALPAGSKIEGYIPRPMTGFQVKRQDMPPHAIATEMSPDNILRGAICDLAEVDGAYIIVSSDGSVADSALTRRKMAMAKATSGLSNPGALTLDFYDRTRLASWVRDNAGLILWVRKTIGRAIHGWEPYGPWSYPPGGSEDVYLADQGVTICRRPAKSPNDLSAVDGIAAIREILRGPQSVVRLIGLSGVGKTRLIQALFDARVGRNELDPALALYTNMNDVPDPQPIALASDLVATGTRAILIVDNCAPELHARLAEVAKRPAAKISVLTVEYDIRDDLSEGTEVYEVNVASIGLVEKLLRRRFPTLSQVDAHTAAEFSGGNARIAVVLAETVSKGGELEGLSDDQLFQRLFVQRHDRDVRLLEIAQACSLVYSFNGEDVSGGDSGELAIVGKMIGVSADEVYRAIAELIRRNLAQSRGVWRAILPHAIANKLAVGALQNLPRPRIESSLVNGAPPRIARSFSRQLGYLHNSKEAKAFVRDWFAPKGWISEVWNLNEFGQAIFENVLPVDPEAGLAVVERSVPPYNAGSPLVAANYMLRSVRSIAYDAGLFERAIEIIRLIAIHGDVRCSKEAVEVHASLFPIHLSGTHASVEQRAAIARALINSANPSDQELGFAALNAMLKATHFSSHYEFQFGARSRDYGFYPKTKEQMNHWYRTALALAVDVALSKKSGATRAKDIIASKFRGLWSRILLRDELVKVVAQFVEEEFWGAGWRAVKSTIYFDEKDKTSENYERLVELEMRLRPVNLVERVRGRILNAEVGDYDVGDDDDPEFPDRIRIAMEKRQLETEALGVAVGEDRNAFREVLPELFSGNANLWHFGVGFVKGTKNPKEIWGELVEQFGRARESGRNITIFSGMLFQIQLANPNTANDLLDECLAAEPLASSFPIIQSSIGIDRRGIERLVLSLELGIAPIQTYRHLNFVRATDRAAVASLAKFIGALTSKPGGQSVALDILQMKFFSDNQDSRTHAVELIAAGRELLKNSKEFSHGHRNDHALGNVVNACLAGDGGDVIARQICENLLDALDSHATYGFEHNELLSGLFKVQSIATLDALFGGEAKRTRSALRLLDASDYNQKNPIAQIPESVLLGWADRESKFRYKILATIIDAFDVPGDDNPSAWSPTAIALVHGAPESIPVMQKLIDRLRPTIWGGSRASLLESRVKLLDAFEGKNDTALIKFIAAQKAELLAEAAAEREAENREDKMRDETFE